MIWGWVAVAAAVASLMTALSPAILRGLPPPRSDEDDVPDGFGFLATRGFLAAVFATVFTATLLPLALLPPWQAVAWLPLGTCGALLALIDARTTFLPLRLTQAGWALAAAGVLAAALLGGDPMIAVTAGGAALALAGGFHLLWLLSRGGIGYGDVRLMGLIGGTAGVVGWRFVVWALLFGALTGALVGVIGHRFRQGKSFPYGPSLAAGPYLALVFVALTGG